MASAQVAAGAPLSSVVGGVAWSGPGGSCGVCAFIVPYLLGQTLDSGPPLGTSSVKPPTVLGVQRTFYCL